MTHRPEIKTMTTPTAPRSWYLGLIVLIVGLLIGGAL